MGSKEETSLVGGSLLDDNLFHDVVISRDRRDIIMSVDRLISRDVIPGEFTRLNLDQTLYIGGGPLIVGGHSHFDNFTGCIENMYFNHTKVIGPSNSEKDPTFGNVKKDL